MTQGIFLALYFEIFLIILAFVVGKNYYTIINGLLVPKPHIARFFCIAHAVGLGLISYFGIIEGQIIFNPDILGFLNTIIPWLTGFMAFGAIVKARKPFPLAPKGF